MNSDPMLEYYRRRAGEYDRIYLRDNPARQSELADLYALSRRVLAGRTVLDLACGTGFWTRIISEKAASITGIDINASTLVQAQRKRYLCPAGFVQGDLYNLPFLPRRFDGLMVSYVVSHVLRQDLGRLGLYIRKMSRPRAAVFVCDNNLICEKEPELVWDDDHINSYKERRLENGETYVILKNYFEPGELKEMFANWGEIVSFIYRDYYWAAVLRIG